MPRPHRLAGAAPHLPMNQIPIARRAYEVTIPNERGTGSTFTYQTYREAYRVASHHEQPIYFRDSRGNRHLCTHIPGQERFL